MKTFAQNNKFFIAIEVEDCADDFSINRSQDDFEQMYLQYVNEIWNGLPNYTSIYLPKGNVYSVIGLLSSIPESKAAEMVEEVQNQFGKNPYRTYNGENWEGKSIDWVASAISSLKSRIESLGMDVSKPILIIEIK